MSTQLEELFEMFIQNMEIEKDISKTTKSSYKGDFNIFLNFLQLQGIKPDVSLINKNILKQYFHFLKFNKGYSVATMRRKIHSLSSFFKYIYDEDLIEKNPMKSIKAPKKPQELPIYIKSEDVKAILASVDGLSGNFVLRDKVFFLLLFLAGLRRTELINLRWKYINFQNNTITIFKSKGQKSRVVPLITPLNIYLKLLFDSKKCDRHDYVLYSSTYNKMSATSANLLFKKYLIHNNLLDKGYTLHKCRHTFATNLAMSMDSLEIAEILGHNDVNTTKVYIHLSQNALKNKISDSSYAKDIKNIMK